MKGYKGNGEIKTEMKEKCRKSLYISEGVRLRPCKYEEK
jgi:hypothetical protein